LAPPRVLTGPGEAGEALQLPRGGLEEGAQQGGVEDRAGVDAGEAVALAAQAEGELHAVELVPTAELGVVALGGLAVVARGADRGGGGLQSPVLAVLHVAGVETGRGGVGVAGGGEIGEPELQVPGRGLLLGSGRPWQAERHHRRNDTPCAHPPSPDPRVETACPLYEDRPSRVCTQRRASVKIM